VEQQCYTHQRITTAHYDQGIYFNSRSQKYELLHVSPSAWNNSTPIGRIFINLIFEYISKRCQGNSKFHKSCIQQEEDSFYQQIGFEFEEETSKMVHLEHGFVRC
jgi:predicted fused transcriptional regulator/phosphomethylpyrimidine kinase